jgi:hypothetical protein
MWTKYGIHYSKGSYTYDAVSKLGKETAVLFTTRDKFAATQMVILLNNFKHLYLLLANQQEDTAELLGQLSNQLNTHRNCSVACWTSV